MSDNIFDTKYSDFYETDIRKNRTTLGTGYAVTSYSLQEKHRVILPPEMVRGKRILDLGCCVAATGGWVLEYGAARYVGVELQNSFATLSKQNLTKCFPTSNWEIIESDFTDFFKNNIEQFDIVIAAGVIYTDIHYQEFIKSLVALAPTIIIESNHPSIFRTPGFLGYEGAEFIPIVYYEKAYSMIHEDGYSITSVHSAVPSIMALSMIFDSYGYNMDLTAYSEMSKIFPRLFNKHYRFVTVFNKVKNVGISSFSSLYKSKSGEQIPIIDNEITTDKVSNKEYSLANLANYVNIPQTWVFDTSVASVFTSHAKKHIPDYIKVIQMGVDLCISLVDTSHPVTIIDVGSATGETLLHCDRYGFVGPNIKLVGVDNSQEMLNESQRKFLKDSKSKQALLICSDQFPIQEGPFSAVLCNWTLHFIEDKVKYLYQIYAGMLPGAFLVLSEKTKNDGVELEMYHTFKRKQGVSEEEIVAKAASLVGVMFINDVEWYFNTLRQIGFRDISIINAAPCFTTFLAFK